MSTPASPFRSPGASAAPVVADAEIAAQAVAWTACVAAGRAAAETAAAAIEVGTHGHVVDGLPDTGTDAPLRDALESMRVKVPYRIRLALPTAGDPLGLVGIGPFTAAAIIAEAAVVAEYADGSIGWVPELDRRGSSYAGVRWRLYQLDETGPAIAGATGSIEPDRIIEQADRALRRALRAAADTLGDVDLALWRPEVGRGRAEAEAALQVRVRAMPPSWPVAARALGERAIALWRVLRVATADLGAASASGSRAKVEALRLLSHSVRETAMIAYNLPSAALLEGSASGCVAQPDGTSNIC